MLPGGCVISSRELDDGWSALIGPATVILRTFGRSAAGRHTHSFPAVCARSSEKARSAEAPSAAAALACSAATSFTATCCTASSSANVGPVGARRSGRLAPHSRTTGGSGAGSAAAGVTSGVRGPRAASAARRLLSTRTKSSTPEVGCLKPVAGLGLWASRLWRSRGVDPRGRRGGGPMVAHPSKLAGAGWCKPHTAVGVKVIQT